MIKFLKKLFRHEPATYVTVVEKEYTPPPKVRYEIEFTDGTKRILISRLGFSEEKPHGLSVLTDEDKTVFIPMHNIRSIEIERDVDENMKPKLDKKF